MGVYLSLQQCFFFKAKKKKKRLSTRNQRLSCLWLWWHFCTFFIPEGMTLFALLPPSYSATKTRVCLHVLSIAVRQPPDRQTDRQKKRQTWVRQSRKRSSQLDWGLSWAVLHRKAVLLLERCLTVFYRKDFFRFLLVRSWWRKGQGSKGLAGLSWGVCYGFNVLLYIADDLMTRFMQSAAGRILSLTLLRSSPPPPLI